MGKLWIEAEHVPLYTVSEAAHYLRLPRTTLRTWLVPGAGLITAAESEPPKLSFLNLVEAFVLAAIRRDHGVTLEKIRKAVRYTERQLGQKRPLASRAFETDGVEIFVRHMGHLIEASSESGQLVLREALEQRLQRIDRNELGIAARLFPLTRTAATAKQPKSVVIDPRISFGRPVLAGTGVRTEIVVERYRAGESVGSLAKDYGVSAGLVEDAIRAELRAAA